MKRDKNGKVKYFDALKLQWQLQLMTIPGMIHIIIFSFIPIYGLIIAFQSYTVFDTFGSAQFVGLENFRIIVSDRFFWESVRNTLGISLIKLFVGFPLQIILSIMIFEMASGILKKVIQTVSYLPHFLSWIILGGMIISWSSTNGLFNNILAIFGLSTGENHLLNVNRYWAIAALSDVWKEAGWGTILYLATMSGIDHSLYEAAKIDGAGKIRQIIYITMPMLKTIIALKLVLWVSGIFGSNLDQTLVLINTQNRARAEVINSYVFRIGLAQGDFSYATAVGLGLSIVSVTLLLLTNYVTKKLNDNSSIL